MYQGFVGIESLNPDNLNFATKYQNTDDRHHKLKIEESRARVINKYRRVVENWHKVGVSVHAGYMLGFPFDGPHCGRVAAQTLKKIGFDIVSFFIMTPLPGTEDQVRYAKEGDIIDWDFNQLDSQHVTLRHPRLDTRQWMQAYRERSPASTASARRCTRSSRSAAGASLSAESRRSTLRQFCYYFFSHRQGRHPMVGGIWQIRRRDVRRAAISDDEALRYYLGGCASARSCAASRTASPPLRRNSASHSQKQAAACQSAYPCPAQHSGATSSRRQTYPLTPFPAAKGHQSVLGIEAVPLRGLPLRCCPGRVE